MIFGEAANHTIHSDSTEAPMLLIPDPHYHTLRLSIALATRAPDDTIRYDTIFAVPEAEYNCATMYQNCFNKKQVRYKVLFKKQVTYQVLFCPNFFKK